MGLSTGCVISLKRPENPPATLADKLFFLSASAGLDTFNDALCHTAIHHPVKIWNGFTGNMYTALARPAVLGPITSTA